MVVTFTPFIHHCTLCLWNKTTVENLITALSDTEIPSESRTVAHTLLKDLTVNHPKLFRDVIPTLAQWIIDRAAEVSRHNTREDKIAIEDVLKVLSRLDPVELPGKQGKEFIDALKTFALEGETEKQGRRATMVLLKMKRRHAYADELVKVFTFSTTLIIANCAISHLRERILCQPVGKSVQTHDPCQRNCRKTC
jgi:hypothetical protein